MPIPLIVLGVLLLLLLSLLLLRIRVVITYRETVRVQLRILFLHFCLYPRKKRLRIKRYSKKQTSRAERKAAKKAARTAKRKKGHAPSEEKRTLRDSLTLVRAISATLIRHTKKHLHLHAARLHIRVATGDAASTAILHGAVCGSLSHLLAGLDRLTALKATPPDVCVEPDFTAERSSADIKLIFSIRVFAAITASLAALISRMKHKAGKKNKRKNTPSDKKGA